MNILGNVFRSAENPNTPLSSPAGWLVDLIGGTSSSGVNVTPETSITLPAVWSAVTLLSQSLGALPIRVSQEVSGKKQPVIHPVGTLLKNKPNDMMTSFQWKQLMMAHTQLWGNGYSLIVRGADTRPTELIPYHPRDVQIKLRDGKYWYILSGQTKKPLVVDSSNVVHFKGLGFDGIKGKSVIGVMRDNIGLGLSAQKVGSEFYKNGMKLDGVIKVPHGMKDDGVDNLRNSFKKTYNSNGERLMILDGGMEYESIGIPPDDSQFIETRKFSVTDVARMFRVPPPLLYDLERATFSNISELILSFVKFSLNPLVINFEEEINDKLFREDEKATISTKFSLEGLLRGSPQERAEFYQKLIMNGVMNPNEARAKEDMQPYDAGDTFVIPSNLMEVGKEPTNKNNN